MKYKKTLIILFNLVLLLFILSNPIFARHETGARAMGEPTTQTTVDKFQEAINGLDVPEIQTTGGKILGIIRVIGTIIAVGMIMVLGIKYMVGSAEQKAEYKKTLLPYLIGAILLFTATYLADLIYNWAKGL